VKAIGVVGAGLMGSEIALVFALAGHEVQLIDRSAEVLEETKQRLQGVLQKGIGRGFYTSGQAGDALSVIKTSDTIGVLAGADVVIEAVFESLEVKAKVLTDVAAICRTDTLIASNTSTIPISTLAAQLPVECRTRFLGTHFFSPVSRMKLVEVIPAFDSDMILVNKMMDILRHIGKEPILVKDVAGFAVNRMLHAFIIEAVRLVEEGVASPEDLDKACRLGLGHPIGPFALMDAVTSSLCVEAQEIMQEAYGERFRPPPLLKQRVRAGLIGGKGRTGWIAP
jgi:3-hydroxybutyryl-CoA dehydrogenase